MNSPRRHRTMSIRRWLSLALAALFLAPLLILMVIGVFVFRDQQGPWALHQETRDRLIEDAGQWEDPKWQATTGAELARDGADVILLVDGKEIFQTRLDPLAGWEGSHREVRTIDVPGTDPPQQAHIFTTASTGPPEELREWFVPIALLTALIGTLAAIAWFLRHSIILPLTAASDAARRIAAGELDISLPASRVREVAELNRAFESMGDELRSSLRRQVAMERDRRLFISAIAHDLRTPLFSLRGSLEGLEKGIASTPEKRARYIAIAQDKAAVLERLISDLFTFTRMEYMDEAPNRTLLDIDEFLPHLVEGIRPRAETNGIHVALDAASTRVNVEADSHLLTRAVENLLDNALRHTPVGGTVRVEWSGSDSTVSISIRDTGPGIAEADLPQLFDPLYRGESSRNRKTGGAGLGLTIARRIVEAHGGTLVAANNPEGGAVFTVTLPKERGADHPAI